MILGWKPRLGAAALLSVVMTPAPTWAQTVSTLDAAVLAGSCMACHGAGGTSPGAIPSIGGRPEKDLAAALLAFRAGSIPGTTVMTRIMKGFDDAEIASLSSYFAAQPAGRVP